MTQSAEGKKESRTRVSERVFFLVYMQVHYKRFYLQINLYEIMGNDDFNDLSSYSNLLFIFVFLDNKTRGH